MEGIKIFATTKILDKEAVEIFVWAINEKTGEIIYKAAKITSSIDIYTQIDKLTDQVRKEVKERLNG